MSTDEIRARDLPVGSVVATAADAWIRYDRPDMPAYCWRPGNYSDEQIDHRRKYAGARVLRYGTGEVSR